MNKKVALVTLLENSYWISDPAKKEILLKLDTFTDAQIDKLGKFLAEERVVMIRDKDKILKNSALLLDTIEDILA
jgi:hypothetical protein